MDPVVTEPRPPLSRQGRTCRWRGSLSTATAFSPAGKVTDRGNANLTLRLQAILYDGPDRTKVVDAAYLDAAPPLKPGETRERRFHELGARRRGQGLARQLLERKAAANVPVEPLQSWSEAAQP